MRKNDISPYAVDNNWPVVLWAQRERRAEREVKAELAQVLAEYQSWKGWNRLNEKECNKEGGA